MESTIIPSPLSTPREDFLLSLKHLLDLGCLLSATASSGCKITRTLKYIFWLNAFSHITKRSDQSCFLILGGETISCYTDFKNTLEKMQLISEDCSKTWWHNSDTGVGRCVRTCGQWKRREVVIIILKKKKMIRWRKASDKWWERERRWRWGTVSIHSSLGATLPFLNGRPDQNGMQRSCSDDSVTPACIWRVNARPGYSRTSTHWDGKNSLPIAFRRARGRRDVMCVCVCMWEGVRSHQFRTD